MKKILFTTVLTFTAASFAQAQQEGIVPTQTLIHEESKSSALLTPSNVKLKVDNHVTSITSLNQVLPSGVQVAILIDDGLRTSFGRNLEDMRTFIAGLPAGSEVLVGYMSNGRVVVAQPFTTDHAAASQRVRIPLGIGGINASPYFCLSDFVKLWPGVTEQAARNPEALTPLDEGGRGNHKARFVMMLTNGVDPYNGSVSPLNQDSPYVQSAIHDAQRAGVAVYSIYYTEQGIRGGAASFSGQGYLQQVADATGGTAYYEGTGNPVSLSPFLAQFKNAIAETYIATFAASGKDLVRVTVKTDAPKVKLRHAEEVRPGTQLSN